VKRSLNVYNTTISKERKKRGGAFPGGVQNTGAPPVKDSIEIPANKGGKGRINFGRNKTKNGNPIRLSFRSINTGYTKNHITVLKFSQNKTTTRISPGIKQGIPGPIKNNKTPGEKGARRNNGQKNHEKKTKNSTRQLK